MRASDMHFDPIDQGPPALRRLRSAVLGSLLASLLALASPAASGRPAVALERGSPGGAPDEAARTVARVEVPAPSHSPFVLRATLPVPPDLGNAAPGRTRLAVRPTPAAERADLAERLDALAVGGGTHALVPAQVEVVSRDPLGRPDVIEIAARVELPEGARRGEPVRWDVVLSDSGAGFELGARPPLPAVDALLAPGSGLRLRARDAWGHLYEARLLDPAAPGFGSDRRLADGPVLARRRTHSTLVPVRENPDAPGPPLVHLMGVHAYVTEWAGEPAVSLDLRVHNGSISGSRAPKAVEQPAGIVYWESLELVVPDGWRVVPHVRDPFFGPLHAVSTDGDGGSARSGERSVPLVRAFDDGKLHMMPPMAQFHRRLVLVPDGEADLARARRDHEGLGFCVRDAANELWSWFNPRTSGYFPQRDLLAVYDFDAHAGATGRRAARARERRTLAELRATLSEGRPGPNYVEGGVMGWAHPWFVRIAYGFGGEGIATFEGHRAAAAAAPEGYAALELLHRMNACRQPEVMFDAAGDVVGYHAWLDAEGRIPFDYRTHGGVVVPAMRLPMGYGPEPSAQVLWVVEHGLRPPYDAGKPYELYGEVPDANGHLLSWWPHDDAHLVRYTKNTKALVWLGNDPLAKDDLLVSAELFHLMFHESPHEPASWSPGITLRVLEQTAREHPHQGVGLGRAHGWGIDAMCAAYSTQDDAWRARNRDWFTRVARLFLAAAQPSGLVQRMDNERLFERRYVSAQVFECLFLIHALHCTIESVLEGVDDELARELEQLALRAVDYLYWGPPFQRVASSWQPDPSKPTRFEQGPRNYVAVAPNDGWQSPVFSDATRWGPDYLPADGLESVVETTHCWQALSFAQDASEPEAGVGLENRYLARLLDLGLGQPSYGALLANLYERMRNGTYDDSPNWIGVVGKLQALGVRPR